MVVSSKANAYGLERAKQAGVPAHVVASKDYKKDWAAMSADIDKVLDKYNVDLVVLAGSIR